MILDCNTANNFIITIRRRTRSCILKHYRRIILTFIAAHHGIIRHIQPLQLHRRLNNHFSGSDTFMCIHHVCSGVAKEDTTELIRAQLVIGRNKQIIEII